MTLRRPFPRRGRAIATAAWPCDSGRLGHTADMKSLGSANRRRMMHLGALALALDLLATAIPACAQAPKVFRIGWLGFALPANPEVQRLEDAFVEALRAQGFAEGQNVVIERRWAEGRPERAAASATEIVQMKVDVIVPVGPGAFAAKQATGTIPIVIVNVGNPDRRIRPPSSALLPREERSIDERRRQRVERRRPGDQSITLSARNSIDWGIVIPSNLAVLRLMTNSNLVGSSTGKSAGRAPFRMRST